MATVRTDFNLRLDKDTFDGFVRRMQERNKRLQSLRPAMIRLAQFLRYELEHNFETEGAYSGPKWAPNAEPYASWKRGERGISAGGHRSWLRPAKSSKVLHRYLNLMRAVTVKAHPDHIEEIGPKGRWVRVGVVPSSEAAKLIKIHGDGGGRLPKREAMRLHPGTRRFVADLLENYIVGSDVDDEGGFLPSAASLRGGAL